MIIFMASCDSKPSKTHVKAEKYATLGTIERLDPKLDDIISESAVIEVLAEGFGWSEGPIWVKEEQKLIFRLHII